jgi:hypothetical protein
VRPVPRISQAPRSGRLPGKWLPARWLSGKRLSGKRLPGRWLAAALITAMMALVAPDISYAATTSQPRPAPAGCIGITPAAFPVAGFITNNSRTEGGHFWWRRLKTGNRVCLGTVVESVQYNSTATKTWKVIIYSVQNPHGQIVAHVTFTLDRGSYSWKFRIRHAYAGLSAVCVTADDSFGTSCVHFGHPQN